MATTWDGVLVAFGELEAGGLRSPFKTDEEGVAAIRLWLSEFREAGDERLMEAVRVHLRGSKWWPKIAEVHAALRRAVQIRPVGDDQRWEHGEAWKRLDGEGRVRVLDQAVRDLRSHQHAGDCGLACLVCTEAILQRCDELAA